MTSAEFLSQLGLRYWRDFERHASNDHRRLACYSETARPDLYQSPQSPLTCDGEYIIGRLGEVGNRLYIQFLGYWLSPRVYMVAATYKPAHTSFDACDIYFFGFHPTRRNRFAEVDPSYPDVVACFEQRQAAA